MIRRNYAARPRRQSFNEEAAGTRLQSETGVIREGRSRRSGQSIFGEYGSAKPDALTQATARADADEWLPQHANGDEAVYENEGEYEIVDDGEEVRMVCFPLSYLTWQANNRHAITEKLTSYRSNL